MKFRNPETGEVFDILKFSRTAFENCAYIRAEANRKELSVFDYIYTYPRVAARLMGYEVVEDDAPTLEEAIDKYLEIKQEEASMDKPLKDWTLGEVNEMCKKRLSCRECIFQNKHDKECKIRTHPTNWDLSDKPHFTEQEVEDAKTVKQMFGRSDTVKRTAESAISFGGIILSAKLFPSIQPGQSYALDEIIGDAE